MNEIWEVRIVRHPAKGQTVKSVTDFDTEQQALEYALVKRRYPCEITIIHRYEVEEVTYERMSV